VLGDRAQRVLDEPERCYVIEAAQPDRSDAPTAPIVRPEESFGQHLARLAEAE
jgi:hypothetical protein